MLGLEKPSAEPTLDLATQPSSRPRNRAAQAATTRPSSARQPAPASDTFTLYLVRGASSAPTGPYAKLLVLRHAEPSKAVWLMDWLTEPSGQAGSGDRQFLVYADSGMLEWAVDVAAMIDVRAAATSPATMPKGVDPLSQAIAALYTVASPTEISRQTADNLVKSLEGYCSHPGDPHRRWAASMITGRLLDDVLGQRKHAIACYERAASLAQQSSPAWLVARYRQANALYNSGNKTEARTVAQDIVKRSGQSYSRVRAYRQAEKLAAGTR